MLQYRRPRQAGQSNSLAARLAVPHFKELQETKMELTESEKKFLQIVNDPAVRAHLLDRLEQLGLLAAFLEAENGTTPEASCPSQK